MNLKGLDLFLLTKLTSHQVDHVTCIECCKYYIAPETASCGHSLCHTCWRGRRTCPSCAAPLEKKSLKLNLPLQNLTEHIHVLVEAFEKVFDIKLDEFVLDETSNDLQSENDLTKNVKDWLASSQNQFTAPLLNSEQFSLEVNSISSSKIQVHMNSKKSISPVKVVYVQPPQDDWDKIEQLPDTEEIGVNDKENSTDHTNKQTSFIQDKEYTTDNPRRSSRKRELIPTEQINNSNEIIAAKQGSKNTSSETDQKSSKAKQNWNNVKRMRREFSKLNKKNRSKLNVSIEMCKKTQSTAKPNTDTLAHLKTADKESQPAVYTIEDNTPDVIENNKPNVSECLEAVKFDNPILNAPDCITKSSNTKYASENRGGGDYSKKSPEKDNCHGSQFAVTKMPFIKKGALYPQSDQTDLNSPMKINNNSLPVNSTGDDDIEITIKIGNTLTNITIKKKNNDVQLRVNTDREVQTSLGSNYIVNKNNVSTNDAKDVNSNPQNIEINITKDILVSARTTQAESHIVKNNIEFSNAVNKSVSTKKNTASAETATAQFEITESVEKELSNIMECVEDNNAQINTGSEKNELINDVPSQAVNIQPEDHVKDYINDLDIFDNGSLHEKKVHLLNTSKQAPSEILMSTVKNTRTQTQNHPDKRGRDDKEEYEEPCAKKVKNIPDNTDKKGKDLNNMSLDASHRDIMQTSESINYDAVMGQVFASIDADIEMSQKTAKGKKEDTLTRDVEMVVQSQCLQSKTQTKGKRVLGTQDTNVKSVNEVCYDKYSENVFSIIEKDDEIENMVKKANDKDGSTQRHIENLLTPGMCHDLISTHEENLELVDKTECTPFNEHYDSDKSVVEETPQKNVSIPKHRSASELNNNANKQLAGNLGAPKSVSINSKVGKSIINVSDTLDTTKDQTIIETVTKKQTLETPLTINKFLDHIKHNSTPMARKSLNFEKVDDVDLQQTLCPSSVASRTTQEKEFMCKAFEQTQKSPVTKPLASKMININDLKYCIAGSCLNAIEISNVKLMCKKFNWKYVDKYTRELTHLVVGVDEENRSQRSVKYMCALAASKWIVSYDWVKACLLTNMVAGESLYEALDGTGEPGPRRARMARGRLFAGITFFCMPPFSVLDLDALKEMLESAGGRVVSEAREARACGAAPALLLAEPEHTQEDRFVYLALELSIVPVNYEWVLNCLGSYSLSPIHELLLCPASLLPRTTADWPPELMARDSE